MKATQADQANRLKQSGPGQGGGGGLDNMPPPEAKIKKRKGLGRTAVNKALHTCTSWYAMFDSSHS